MLSLLVSRVSCFFHLMMQNQKHLPELCLQEMVLMDTFNRYICNIIYYIIYNNLISGVITYFYKKSNDTDTFKIISFK